MQNKKKILFFIFCIFSVSAFLIGCSSQKQNPSKHTQNNTNSITTNTAASVPDNPSSESVKTKKGSHTTKSRTGKTTVKKRKITSITISATGDCTFGSDRSSPASVNFYSVYNKKKPEYFFRNVKKIFQKDDTTLVNFEGTLTDSNSRMDKTYAFKGSPSYVQLLKKALSKQFHSQITTAVTMVKKAIRIR